MRINKIFAASCLCAAFCVPPRPMFPDHPGVPAIVQESTNQENPAQTVRFEGEVKAGEAFEKAIGSDLIFQLKPSHDPAISGWTIEIHPKIQIPGEYAEFVYVVTPPYRSGNARYLDTSYGTTAKKAVAWTPRVFSFVIGRDDYQRASKALNKLLWPYNYSETEVDAAGKLLDELPKGEGQLRIVGSKIVEGESEKDLGKIEWLKFAVELKFPPAKGN